MLDKLTAYELAEWEAYDRLDPVGTWREDFRMAFLSSLITNIAIKWGAGKKQVKLTEIMDFMPVWDQTAPKEIKKQSIDEMKQVLKEILQSQKKETKAGATLKRPPAKLNRKKDG